MEEELSEAETKIAELEYTLFTELREHISKNIARIQNTSSNVAIIDVLVSLAEVAETNSYVKPQITTDGKIDIVLGRHPIVEKMLKNEKFIENDCMLDNEENTISVITGPNMSGKSTYMRQVALITILAQMGAFVPAKKADICIVDKIFTRIGAADDLSMGQSTFMMEMVEVANILKNATSKSLVILDEIGRGTSTYDGMSIATAVSKRNRKRYNLFKKSIKRWNRSKLWYSCSKTCRSA